MMEVDRMLEVFTCPICLEYAEEAVSTSCCQQVYCKLCIMALPGNSSCPSCRSGNNKVTFVPAVAIQRALEQLIVKCPHSCGNEGSLKRGQLKTHLLSCTKRPLPCPCPTCLVPPMPADTLAEHIGTIHGAQLITHAARLFEDLPVARDGRIETINNINRRSTRLGTNGMRYCGGNLPLPKCGCCNGTCGPENGCACDACMVLELNLRKLPQGWLINKKGASCTKGEGGKFYCGRKSEKGLRGSDGWCGPTNGPQCEACVLLQRLALVWYYKNTRMMMRSTEVEEGQRWSETVNGSQRRSPRVL